MNATMLSTPPERRAKRAALLNALALALEQRLQLRGVLSRGARRRCPV